MIVRAHTVRGSLSLAFVAAVALVGCVHEAIDPPYNGEGRALVFEVRPWNVKPVVLPVREAMEWADDRAVGVRHPRAGTNNCLNATGGGCYAGPTADELELVEVWCVDIRCTASGVTNPINGTVNVGAVAPEPGSGHLRVRVRVPKTGEVIEDSYPVRFALFPKDADAGDASTGEAGARSADAGD